MTDNEIVSYTTGRIFRLLYFNNITDIVFDTILVLKEDCTINILGTFYRANSNQESTHITLETYYT